MQEWVAADSSRTIRRFDSHQEQEARTCDIGGQLVSEKVNNGRGAS